MDRRLFLIFLGLIAALPASAVRADDGEEDDNSGSHESGGGDDDHEEDDSPEDEHEDGSSGNEGSSGSSHSGSSGGGEDDDEDDQYEAQDAVRYEGAVPLETVMRTFNTEVGGQVIDVKIVRNFFRLEYKFIYIDGDGRVKRAYFDAKTGDYLS